MVKNYKRNTLKTTVVLFLVFFTVGIVFFTSSGGKADAKNAEPEQGIETSKSVQQMQKTPVDYITRGSSYLQKGEIEDAISDYNKAIEKNPGFAVAYYSRGRAYSKKGEINKARSDYNKAIALNPDDADAYINRGHFYHSMGVYYRPKNHSVCLWTKNPPRHGSHLSIQRRLNGDECGRKRSRRAVPWEG